jgi:hypothetical protein
MEWKIAEKQDSRHDPMMFPTPNSYVFAPLRKINYLLGVYPEAFKKEILRCAQNEFLAFKLFSTTC